MIEQVRELETQSVVQLTAQIAAKLNGDIVAAKLLEHRPERLADQSFRPIAIDGAARTLAAGDNTKARVVQVIRARA